MIKSGEVYELYEYERVYAKGKKRKPKRHKSMLKWKKPKRVKSYRFRFSRKTRPKKQKEGGKSRLTENRLKSQIRRRNNVRRLILANFDNKCKFLTLTFRDGAIADVRDVKLANRAFKKFIQRLRYAYGNDFKYVAVIEFQDKNGRGAVHYHVITDCPYGCREAVESFWGQGFIDSKDIHDISNVDNVGAYVIKYMTKDMYDDRLCGLPAYLVSRNCEKPKEIIDLKEIENILHNLGNPVYESTYSHILSGDINYKEYNKRRENQDD